MTVTSVPIEPSIEPSIEEVAGRLFESGLATIELFSVYLGLRLGLYRSLVDQPGTPPQLAERAAIDVRYAQEWLEQQTVAGFLTCADRRAAAGDRVYALPAASATVLLDDDHPACTAPLGLLAAAGCAGVLPALLTAYRSGGGVPYSSYGTDFREGQAGFNRPAFVHLLADSWLAEGAPEVHQRLRGTDASHVADIACGSGWSSIVVANAYPNTILDGFDIDDASIADARRNAVVAGVDGRVRFEVRDAATLIETDTSRAGTYDLVTIFEALHDMARPVEALKACRALCAPQGSVIVMDQRAAETFAESDGPVERFLYGASVLHCLPVGMAEQPSAGTGTVMRPDTMRRYAREAGFTGFAILPIEHDLFRFYHLLP